MADDLAREKGRQLERAEMYEVAFRHHDGTAVTENAEANIVKMKAIMEVGSQLQGDDIEAGILWQLDDAFGQVIGLERGGRVRGVGFGPTPFGNRARNMEENMPLPTSTATDQRAKELSTQVEAMREQCTRSEAQVEEMREKCAGYDAIEAEVRFIRAMFTQLYPNLTMSTDGDGGFVVDIQSSGAQCLFDDTH